ncbi:MAG TPA: hypothetical protein VN611_02040 [Patescibacteria group bacterium]|nr:hypothetical protein [Patescibacteria group bacterium]
MRHMYIRIWTALLMVLMVPGMAAANLGDTRDNIREQYGEYRMVYGFYNQLYTREAWEEKKLGLREGTYRHIFTRLDLPVTLDVDYESRQPDALVRQQRFVLGKAIAVKDFKKYFPEIYQALTGPSAKTFATKEKLSELLSDEASPVTLGVVTKQFANGDKKGYYMLVAFNIMDEGRLVKDIKYIDGNTQITEFIIEQTTRYTVTDLLTDKGKWKAITNYFL